MKAMKILLKGIWLSKTLLLSLVVWLGVSLINVESGISNQSSVVAIAAPQTMATQVEVHLGTEAGELKFVPDRMEFEAGKRYKLVLDNPSPTKHYFTAKDFADAIWSQKVDAGNVEIKGAIHELELRPGAIADWVFIPLKPGTYELHCSIPGHAEAGMTGTIVIRD
jgi:uncharacterized cupredoxin-like copper-binding protein